MLSKPQIKNRIKFKLIFFLNIFFFWLIRGTKSPSIDDCRLANQFLVNKFGAKLSMARRQGIYDDVVAVVVVKLLSPPSCCFWS